MRLFALVIATLIPLTACQTTEKAGSGPISDMPDNIISSYKNYRQIMEETDRQNMVFAYNKTDRSSGWVSRRENDGIGHAIEEALEICGKNRTIGTCEILDIDGRIVWQGVDAHVLARLLEELPDFVDTQTHEYDGKEYRITDRQLKKFRLRSDIREQSDFSAFFVSGDGVNYGDGYTDSRSPSGHSSAVHNARGKCKIASPERKCYLFTTNGEPVNDDARRALERDN
ncbi:hypothetical protein NBZ79_00305 [Sneathiella marina]|uniref:Uncharacterized protein n=1 Tax=Sneathiella marina TaxID=2950108 RepID=A0ABY4W2L6_9PROT|nr:hypothetical protein [Sneathiella marina]USG61416.1 hypothetical protein NBZ79_00305 [Sneathiella marina]